MEIFIDFIIVSIAVIVAYLLGSIPTSVWVAKYRYGIDIRQHGSGNAGATNTFRVLGKKAGSFVMIIDISKGFLATSFASLLVWWNVVEYDNFWIYKDVIYKLIFGAAAVIGHIFPIFAKFKGGKGVATYLGVISALSYKFFFIFGISWIILSFLFRYASLSSIISSLLVFLYVYFLEINNYSLILFIFFVIILYTHKENIARLKDSKENKIKL